MNSINGEARARRCEVSRRRAQTCRGRDIPAPRGAPAAHRPALLALRRRRRRRPAAGARDPPHQGAQRRRAGTDPLDPDRGQARGAGGAPRTRADPQRPGRGAGRARARGLGGADPRRRRRPAERAERQEAIARSREALQTLKPQELRALSLLAEGYSYAEIGEITGFSQTKINRCLAEGTGAVPQGPLAQRGRQPLRGNGPVALRLLRRRAGGEEAATLREHLRACANCRATLRAYRAAPGAAAALAPALPLSARCSTASRTLRRWRPGSAAAAAAATRRLSQSLPAAAAPDGGWRRSSRSASAPAARGLRRDRRGAGAARGRARRGARAGAQLDRRSPPGRPAASSTNRRSRARRRPLQPDAREAARPPAPSPRRCAARSNPHRNRNRRRPEPIGAARRRRAAARPGSSGHEAHRPPRAADRRRAPAAERGGASPAAAVPDRPAGRRRRGRLARRQRLPARLGSAASPTRASRSARSASAFATPAETSSRRPLPWDGNRIEHIHVPSGSGRLHGRRLARGLGGEPGPAVSATLRFDDVRPGPARPLSPAGWIAGTMAAAISISSRRAAADLRHPRLRGLGRPRGRQLALRRAGRCSLAETDLRAGSADDSLARGPARGHQRRQRRRRLGLGMRSDEAGSTVLRVDATAPRSAARRARRLGHGPVRVAARRTDALSGMAAGGPSGPFTAIAVDGGVPRIELGAAAAHGHRRGHPHGRPSTPATPPATSATARRRPTVAIDESPPRGRLRPSQDPAEPERIEATVADPLSGPDPGRGSIAVRPAGIAPALAAAADDGACGGWSPAGTPTPPARELRVQGERLRRGRQRRQLGAPPQRHPDGAAQPAQGADAGSRPAFGERGRSAVDGPSATATASSYAGG